MSRYTPGPWQYQAPLKILDANGQPLMLIALAHAQYATDEANAHLISAAPELLDALRQWKFAEETGDDAELENARHSRDAAIAKAKGEAHD